ncbi:MAG TPA: histidine kinase [candidate division Zixibacteria bacterium]|nr:histidine kinase [candidate division Zixibacteria bacterium]
MIDTVTQTEHPDDQPATLFARRWVRWAVLLAAWSIPAVMTGGLLHARTLQRGEESSLLIWIAGKLIAWWFWALLTPLIVSLGRRFPLDRRWFANGLWHVVFATVLGTVQSAWLVMSSMWIHNELLTPTTFLNELIPFLMYSGPWAFMVYWGTLGVAYAIDNYNRLRDRELATSRLETQVAKAKLDALQRQLQPHFLFNTLNSIAVLIQKGDTQNAHRMITGLSDLLRYVLAHDNQSVVPLRDELEFVRRYTEIEKMRFGDRLEIAVHVPESALQVMVPSFCVQTLVENAVRHGVSHITGPGRIGIDVASLNGRLKITVDDNGAGLSDRSGGAGVGLKNIRRQLTHLYGTDHVFTLANNDSGGAVARLEVPIEPAAPLTGTA